MRCGCQLLLLLPLCSWALDDGPQKPLPPEVLSSLAAYEKSVTAARRAYDAAEQKARGVATDELQKAKLSYMQKGDLEGANLVAGEAKRLVAGETLDAIERFLRKQSDLLGLAADPRLKLVGRWQVSNTVGWSGLVVVNDRFEAQIEGGPRGSLVVNHDDGSLSITYDNGIRHDRLAWDSRGTGLAGADVDVNGKVKSKIFFKK